MTRLRLQLLLFTILHLLQAALTHLTHDEAYYRAYAQHLDWGYFDHPPMVAGMIAAGMQIFGDNAFGVRFFFVLSQAVALWVVFERLLSAEQRIHMPLAWMTIIFLNVYGWVATTDAPLFLAAALFFWMYKRFCTQQNWLNAGLLGLTMAAMMYAKYHGFFIILITLASNWRLLTSLKAWAAVVVSLLVFMPHLYWQVQNNWVTVGYHIGERSPEDYVPRHSLEFVINQLLLYSPFVFCIVQYRLWRTRRTDALERALQYLAISFPLICLALTLKVYAEPHWTYTIAIALLYFLPEVNQNPRSAKWLKWSAWILLPLMVAIRLFLMYPNKALPPEFFRTKQMALAAQKAAGDLPILVCNSYQLAASTDFFTQKKTYGVLVANRTSRRNQYNAIWDDELELQQKPVYIVSTFGFEDAEKIPVEGYPDMDWFGKRVEHFQHLKRVKIEAIGVDKVINPLAPIQLSVYNPYDFAIPVDSMQWKIQAIFYERSWECKSVPLGVPKNTILQPKQTQQITVPPIPVDPKFWQKQHTSMMFSLSGHVQPYPVNSKEYFFE
jgi:hypothetical protein